MQLKKNRDKEKRFIVEGEKSVLEFINSDFQVILVAGTAEFYDHNTLPAKSFEKFLAKKEELSSIGTLQTNNAAIAVFSKRNLPGLSPNCDGIVLALDGINDPGNLGTIIRTADWFGITRIILNDDSVDPYNPKVISASKGSLTRVEVHNLSLSSFLDQYTGEVLAADMTGTPLQELNPVTSGVIIMGNESHGISKEVAGYVTRKITIPPLGEAESLNVGVATGIICYSLTRPS